MAYKTYQIIGGNDTFTRSLPANLMRKKGILLIKNHPIRNKFPICRNEFPYLSKPLKSCYRFVAA